MQFNFVDFVVALACSKTNFLYRFIYLFLCAGWFRTLVPARAKGASISLNCLVCCFPIDAYVSGKARSYFELGIILSIGISKSFA